MQLFPLEATVNGDNRFNNLLPADFTDSYRAKLTDFFTANSSAIKKIDRAALNDNDKISYDIFTYEMDMALQGLALNTWPVQQWPIIVTCPLISLPAYRLHWGKWAAARATSLLKQWLIMITGLNGLLPLTLGQIVQSYISKKGMAANYVLPRSLVVKIIPQLQAMVTDSATKSLFYEPIKLLPSNFSDSDKARLTAAYSTMIVQQLIPAYKKLAVFLTTEYLPAARATTGVNALPGGDKYYTYMVKYWTTTNKTSGEITLPDWQK